MASLFNTTLRSLQKHFFKPSVKESFENLSPFDITTHRYFLPTLYAYKNTEKQENFMNSNDIQKSLRETISLGFSNVIGELSFEENGVIKINRNNRNYVEFREIDCEFTFDDVDRAGWFPIEKLPEAFLSTASKLYVDAKSPNIVVELLRLLDGSVVLVVNTNHVIFDGNSIGYLMKCWAATCRGDKLEMPVPDGSRNYNFLSNNPHHDGIFKLEEQTTLSPLDSQESNLQHDNLTTVGLLSKNDQLTVLKADCIANVTREINPGARFSTVDCMVALMLKSLARARGFTPVPVRMFMPVNARKLLGLPVEHFGNVVFPRIVDTDTVTLTTKTLGDVVMDIQDAHGRITSEVINSVGSWINEQEDKTDITFDSPPFCVMFSSLGQPGLQNPYNSLDFGWGNMYQYLMPVQHSVPNIAFIYPSDPKKEGALVMQISVELPTLERLKNDEELMKYARFI